MKAINPKFQEALDKFTANDFWRTVYENAPKGAKAKLETEFQCSANLSDEAVKGEADRVWKDEVKPTMTADDWRYLAQFARHPKQKEYYLKMASEATT